MQASERGLPGRRRDPRIIPGSEWSRLATAGSLLVVVVLLFLTARNPSNWTWLANDDQAAATKPEQSANTGPEVVLGPTDLDAAEKTAAAGEFNKLADKQPLSAGEMPAYWRVMRWVQARSIGQLRERSRSDVLFTHLFEAPQKYRGQLLHLRLHLVRSLSYETADSVGAPKDIKRVYEAWGPTDESQSNPYVVVFQQRPDGFPIAPKMSATVNFDGYFLKLMAYRAGDDKLRAAPLLIGRIDWTPAMTSQQKHKDYFGVAPSVLVFWCCVGFLLIRWVIMPLFMRRKSTIQTVLPKDQLVEDWLRDGSNGEIS